MVGMRLAWLLAVLAITSSVARADDGHCESLKLKPPLTYTQDKAPRDLSGVVSWIWEAKFFDVLKHESNVCLVFLVCVGVWLLCLLKIKCPELMILNVLCC